MSVFIYFLRFNVNYHHTNMLLVVSGPSISALLNYVRLSWRHINKTTKFLNK